MASADQPTERRENPPVVTKAPPAGRKFPCKQCGAKLDFDPSSRMVDEGRAFATNTMSPSITQDRAPSCIFTCGTRSFSRAGARRVHRSCGSVRWVSTSTPGLRPRGFA